MKNHVFSSFWARFNIIFVPAVGKRCAMPLNNIEGRNSCAKAKNCFLGPSLEVTFKVGFLYTTRVIF